MNEMLKIALCGVGVYLVLLPIVGWYRKVKKEMEDTNND